MPPGDASMPEHAVAFVPALSMRLFRVVRLGPSFRNVPILATSTDADKVGESPLVGSNARY